MLKESWYLLRDTYHFIHFSLEEIMHDVKDALNELMICLGGMRYFVTDLFK